jgi:hypothetical protein
MDLDEKLNSVENAGLFFYFKKWEVDVSKGNSKFSAPDAQTIDVKHCGLFRRKQ